jgi:hypothetical protein
MVEQRAGRKQFIITIAFHNDMVGSSADGSPWESLRSFCVEFGSYALSYQRALFPYFVLHDHIHAGNVAKLARGLAEFVGANTPAHRALLECAACLHDCGMALPPRLINELELAEGLIGRDSPKTVEELRAKLGESYARYFKNGVLTLSSKAPVGYLDAYVLRKLHPWISALYVEKHLPALLEGADLEPLTASEVVKPLALLAKWHNSSVEPSDYTCKVGGYAVNLKPLAGVLRLADAMDFSRRRGKFIYEHLVDDLGEKAPSQMKHWIFKMAVEDARLSYGRKALFVKLEGGESGEEVKAKLAGLLFFELVENFLHDYEHFTRSLGTRLGIIALLEGREVDLTGWIGDIEKSGECLKGLKLKIIAKESGHVGGYSSKLLEALKREVGAREPESGTAAQASEPSGFMEDFNIFDALAHALYEKDALALSKLLELIARKCPRAEMLLNRIQPRC